MSSHQIVGGEEAADPAALSAGVSHEGGICIDIAEPQPGPLLAPRVLVMTPGLHPATGVGTALLHQVEHVLAVDGIVPGVLLVIGDVEVPVKVAGSVSLPPGAELSLVLHSPRLS